MAARDRIRLIDQLRKGPASGPFYCACAGTYKLYVIPGSHACRSAMLMLEHKGVPYRRVDIVPLLHPIAVRLRGFDGGGQTRAAGAKRTLGLRLGDRLGTVPALAANGDHPCSRTIPSGVPRSRRRSGRKSVRRLIFPWLFSRVFRSNPARDDELLAELSELLDRVDTLIRDGILNGPQLNAADFMVAPSLALILYRPDVKPAFEGRPALELVDRLLPEPA